MPRSNDAIILINKDMSAKNRLSGCIPITSLLKQITDEGYLIVWC